MKRLFFVFAAVILLSGHGLKAQNSGFKFSAFKNIVISYPARIDIVYSPNYSIEIDDSSSNKVKVLIFKEMDEHGTHSKDLGRYVIEQKDSTLYIKKKADISTDFGRIRIVIKTPIINKIKIETATSVSISGKFNINQLNIDVEGASNIKLTGDPVIRKLSVKNEGASYMYIDLKHSIEHADFDIEGASYVSALSTPIRKVIAKVEGASICKIYPTEELNVRVEGMSYLLYKGNPPRQHINSEGLSIIKQVD